MNWLYFSMHFWSCVIFIQHAFMEHLLYDGTSALCGVTEVSGKRLN